MPGRIADQYLCYHIQIHPQCGACHDTFQADERIVALVCHRNDQIETHYAHKYTSNGYCEQGSTRGVIFCTIPACKHCLANTESATIHADCLALFSRHCVAGDKLHRLWAASTAMAPWRHCVPLVLPYEGQLGDLRCVSKVLEMPKLNCLPVELAEMIATHVGPHIIWRYRTVIERATSLSSAHPNETPKTVFLGDLLGWSRQSEAHTYDQAPSAAYIRLTIDSCGIKQIDRISAPEPLPKSKPTPFHLYITEDATTLALVQARFEFGYCRLVVPETTCLTICNVSISPGLYASTSTFAKRPFTLHTSLRPECVQQCRRPCFIDTRACFGITFFLVRNAIVAAHPHTQSAPTAVGTFRCLSPLQQSKTCWIYLPLPRGEEIVEYGTRCLENDENLYPFPCLLVSDHRWLFTNSPTNKEDSYEVARPCGDWSVQERSFRNPHVLYTTSPSPCPR